MLNSGGKMTKNEKFLIGTLGVISVLALCFVFIISPGLEKTKSIQSEIKMLEMKVESAKTATISIANKEAQLKKLEEEYDKATESMPNTDRMPEALYELEGFAGEVGLSTVSVNLSKNQIVEAADKQQETNNGQTNQQTNMKGLTNFNITINAEGTIDQILAFIDKMENSKRILVVNQVSINENKVTISISYYAAGKNEKENYSFN